MPSLKIAPVAYRPSRLSIPVSPFSPLSPLSPTYTTPKPRNPSTLSRRTSRSSPHFPPPPNPLRWLWQCHICRQKYPIGATRRCLEDGHYFCSGTTVIRSYRKGRKSVVKRHAPCASEFDYQGWRSWGEWRRGEERRFERSLRRAMFDYDGDASMSSSWSSSGSGSSASTPKSGGSGSGGKNCWGDCNYPSECRWGAHISSSSPHVSPQVSLVEPKETVEASASQESEPATTFDRILAELEGFTETNKETKRGSETKVLKEDFWSSMLASAYKRNSKGKSPLQLSTVIEDDESDGSDVSSEDVEMTDVDVDASVPKPPEATLPFAVIDELPDFEGPSAISVTVEQMLKKADRPKLRKKRSY